MSVLCAQSCDTIFNGRMRSEQLADRTGDTETLDSPRKLFGRNTAQTSQGVDHRSRAAHDLCGTGIGSEFAMTGESGHNHGSQETKNQVKDEGSHVVTDTGSIILVAENAAVHEVTDNTRQENDEGVGDPRINVMVTMSPLAT